MSDLRHAGLTWPNGAVAGGNQKILRLPSPHLLMLSSEHWHVEEAQASGKSVLFRGMARQGFRPAELGWNPVKYVAEITRDADRLPPGTIKKFVAWNELNLQDERGDHEPDFGDLTELMQQIGDFTYSVTKILRVKYPDVELHFGAFAPKDETDYFRYWKDSADLCDVIDVHAYEAGAGILGHVEKYRRLFPNHPVNLTEWHSYGMDGDTPVLRGDDDETLQMLADSHVPAYYFAWAWHHPPAHQEQLAEAINVEDTDERRWLFEHPPIANSFPPFPIPPEPEPEPMPPTPIPIFDPESIARATGCPVENVRMYWPKLTEQMFNAGIYEYDVCLGMIGTIAIESASQFMPVHEAFWLNEEDRLAEYVSHNYDGGPNYHGRGGIQHTHRYNYEKLGPKIAALWDTSPNQPDFDLVANPDNLLNPDISAAADVIYFRDTATMQGYSLVEACQDRDWEWVRRLVYGGRDIPGEQRIAQIVSVLEGVDISKVTYNPNEPTHLQEEDFDCAQESTEWAMSALGRHPDDGWMESTMIAEGVLSAELGLLDGTGHDLADFIQRQWGEFGFLSNNETNISFTFAALEGGHAYPILIGGRAWNHWVGVRGYDAGRDVLLLANPSPGYKGVGDTLSEAQFHALGPFNMVRIWHPDLLEDTVADPPLSPPPLPEPPTVEPEPEPLPEPTPEPEPPNPPTPPIPPAPTRTPGFLIGEIRKMLDELEGQMR